MSKIQTDQDLRYIENPFQKIFNIIKPDEDKVYSLLLTLIDQFLNAVKIPCLFSIYSLEAENKMGYQAYDGASGYTYTLIRLAEFFKEKHTLKKVKDASQIYQGKDDLIMQFTDYQFYLSKALEQNQAVTQFILSNKRKKSCVSFYMSEVCTWLCGMHLGYMTRNNAMFRENQMRIIQCYQWVQQNSQKMQFQILYGVPGYLYALLQLQHYYDNLEEQLFRTNFKKLSMNLTHLIIKQGIANHQKLKKKKIDFNHLDDDFRLEYYFYQKQYLGGAHGLAGNLNVLLLSMKMNDFGQDAKILYQVITPSIRFLLKHLINGNYGTSFNSKNIKLVHFCHGCPGIVYCLARYYEMFPQDGIKLGLKEVIELNLDHIWKHGVLKKGFGLCHGISGNAYAFLAPTIQNILPQRIQEYRKKATLFAILRQEKDVLKEIKQYNFPDRLKVGVSDNPYSLMLGIAGDICFVMDAIAGVGRFPGFDF